MIFSYAYENFQSITFSHISLPMSKTEMQPSTVNFHQGKLKKKKKKGGVVPYSKQRFASPTFHASENEQYFLSVLKLTQSFTWQKYFKS